MAQTRNLGLPLLAAGQAQKHVTHNEALDRLDALVHLACLSRTLAAPPADPPEGARYLVSAAEPGGAWEGLSGQIVLREDGVWVGLAPKPGWLAYIEDENALHLFDGAAWLPWSEAVAAPQALSRLGIGTEADAANPFAARLNAALWTARELAEGGSGNLRIALNKPSPDAILSLIFQSGYSGRAELGLLATDDLVLKVSPDGIDWHQAFRVDRGTGLVAFDQGCLRVETRVITASGTWTKPGWARRVTIFAVGGGGGGGSGRRHSAGVVRSGGGGGGAGALVCETFDAQELPASLTVTVGAGGAGADGQAVNSANGSSGAPGGRRASPTAAPSCWRRAAARPAAAAARRAAAAGAAAPASARFRSAAGPRALPARQAARAARASTEAAAAGPAAASPRPMRRSPAPLGAAATSWAARAPAPAGQAAGSGCPARTARPNPGRAVRARVAAAAARPTARGRAEAAGGAGFQGVAAAAAAVR